MVHGVKSVFSRFYWLATTGRWGIHGVFDDLYAGQPHSETFRNIYREVFAEEFAEEADASGFLTMSDLRNISRDLALHSGQSFVDLACGRGGASLWISREMGADVLGIDISSVAIADAERRIASFGRQGHSRFIVGDIAATNIPSGKFDGAMSIDALFMVPDKVGAFRETARILKPGARFAFTTWEVDHAGRVKDYRPLLEPYGFEIEQYDECPGWRRRQEETHKRILAEQETLAKEMGAEAAKLWAGCSIAELPIIHLMRRIYVVARKR